jgi:hypothetical protein
MPFRIHPLGTPHRQITLKEAQKCLAAFRGKEDANPSHVLYLAPTTVFVPTPLPDEDWATLLGRLAD